MRVLFLTSSSDRYGSDRALGELASSLLALGCEVAVSAPRDGPLLDLLRDVGIRTIVAPLCVVDRSMGTGALLRSLLASVRAKPELVDAHRWFRPHVICTNTSHVMDGRPLAKALGARHVCHLREIERIPCWARVLYGYWLTKVADRLLPISKSVEAAYFPTGTSRATVVPDGIDLRYYWCDELSEGACSYSAEHPLRLLAIGRLTPWKGQDIAIAAVAALLATGTPVRLRVVGGAVTDADRHFERRLRAMAEPHGSLISFEGEVDDVREHYRWSDVVLHTSTKPEPFGRVIVEAMASGRPVIASDEGGPREIIQNGVNGLLTTPGDAQALMAIVAHLVRSPPLVARLAASAQARSSEFSVDRTARRVAAVLGEVCGRPPYAPVADADSR